MRPGLALLLAAAASFGAASLAQAATCPTDTVCTSDGCEIINSPSHERSVFDIYGSSSAGYDLKQTGAYIFQLAVGGPGDLDAGSGSVNASDTYVISGLPAGTPVTFHVSLLVTGDVNMSCYGYSATADASIREAGAGMVQVTTSGAACYSNGISQPIGFNLTKTVGEPFTLGFAASADVVGGSVSVYGSLAFTNLPPATTITSCQGFVTGGATAAARHSWGELKLRYR